MSIHTPTAVLFALSLNAAAPGEASMRMLAQPEARAGLLGGMGVTRGDAAALKFDSVAGLPVRVVVPVDGRGVGLDLVPVSVRSSGFRVRVELPDRTWADVDPGPVRTYEGTSPDLAGARVAAFVNGGEVTARIEVPGLPGAYWVEPVSSGALGVEREGLGEGEVVHAGYHSFEVVGVGGVCGADGAGMPVARHRAATGDASGRAVCSSAVCVAELACDSDFEYFQQYGSVSAVQAQIERVVAVMNQQYISEVGIKHRLTTILVRTVAGAPYTSVNGGGVLVQMRDHWNAEQTGIVRDLAQLFTGKALSGSVQGVAISGTVCDTTQAYSIVRSNCCGSLAGATDLTAHELGHIWGATHCACSFPNPISTMNATLTGANSFVTDISGASVASISAGRAGAQCLEPDSPSVPAGAFSPVSPGNGAFGVPIPIQLSWGASAGAQFYSVLVSLHADMSDPIVSYATHGLSYEVEGLLNAEATRYYWRVEAWNSDSVRTVWTPGTASFTTAVPAPACPGDFTGDSVVNVVDLTLLLGAFGGQVNPGQNGDMNGDGAVNTSDLPSFLARFGSTCP